MTSRFRVAALSIAACGALALAGCGEKKDGVEAKNESAESVAEKVANSGIRPQPGRWESKMTIDKMEVAGMPPEAKEMMQKQMGAAQTFFSCLTPEEAAKPEGDFFQKGAEGCTYEHFTMADGKIDARMKCDQDGRTQVMTMAGTYGEDNYAIKMNADGEMAPGMPMSMAMTVSSKRVGECNGKEES